MSTVAVLGAGGTIAPAIVRDLAGSAEIDELLLLDLDPGRAEAVAASQGAGKARAGALDARSDGALAEALVGADVLVNSASYRINLDAMEACLASGTHYLDLGGLYWMTARQLELSGRFEAAGLLGVLGIGSAPGKTNLMAVKAVKAVEALGGPRELDALHVSAAGRDLDPPDGESFPYALRTLLDEVTMAPIAVRDGEPVELEPLSDGGEIDFGGPIGRARALHTLHSEMLTFPASFGCREGSFRLALSPQVESRLRELTAAGATGEEKIAAAQRGALPPSAQTVSVHLVEASAGGRTATVRSVTPPHEGWGLGGGIVSTASPIAAAARLLSRGEIDLRGVFPPELCLAPDPIFDELRERGVRFDIETTEEVTA